MANIFLIRVHLKRNIHRDFLKGVCNDAFVVYVLIFFEIIKAYIVNTHLNYFDKFIKSYMCGN